MNSFPAVSLLQSPPEPLRGREPGSWANYTVRVRLPGIARRVIEENNLPPDSVSRLEALIAEIPDDPIRLRDDPFAPDAADWAGYVAPYMGQNWMEPPWFFIEMYFFRRILEATGYFRPGVTEGLDPYAFQKREGLEAARPAIRSLIQSVAGESVREAQVRLMAAALWGNQSDLSIWSVQSGQTTKGPDLAHLLLDDRAKVIERLNEQPGGRIDFLIDNAGFELATDLILADHLLRSQAAGVVTFHLKPYPTYVSDATVPDVGDIAAWLLDDESEEVRGLARRVRRYLTDGRLRLRSHPFWTSPRAFWEMPDDLRATLGQANLLVSKGDAHYRRLLGDLRWPPTTDFELILQDRPAPLLALRTCKSDVIAGLTPEQVQRADAADPDWRINGRWGLIQFAG